jgi:hypothetical protein
MGVAVLVGALALFALDAIQVRSGVPEENLGAYTAGTILTEIKFATSMLALLFFGWGGFKTAGRSPQKLRKSERSGLTAEVLKAQKRDG